MTYVDGTINVGKGQVEEGSLNPPVIIKFDYVQDLGDLNKFSIAFSVSNCLGLILIQTINNVATTFNVFEQNQWFGIRDEKFDTVFQLKATNRNGTTPSGYITVTARKTVVDPGVSILSATLLVKRVASTSDEIDVSIELFRTEEFGNEGVAGITLYYRKQGSEKWKTLKVSTKDVGVERGTDGNIKGYFYQLAGAFIEREFLGGYFDFYVSIKVNDSEEVKSEIQTLFFENIQITPSKKGTQTFPKAEILDAERPALLRYEIKINITEGYLTMVGPTSYKDRPMGDNGAGKAHFFLEAKDDTFIQPGSDFTYIHVKKTEETKGYMFPACVSEILPCILVSKLDGSDDQKSKLIILFWKINDDFFNYSFLSGQVSIRTDSLVVKVQYKNSGTYTDLTEEITLTQEEHYNPEDNKFVLRILSDDTLSASLFNQVKESDNYSDNLRILIVKHEVYCSTSNGPNDAGTFTFDKLLIPHEWKYICYDKFLGKNAAARIDENKLSLSLDSPYLRGIKIPEKSFLCFDKFTEVLVKYREPFDLSVFHKLRSEVEAFYSDPILEGTINSIELTKIPDDVFLIPPDLKISDPNLIKSGIGSEKAEGVVRLNEYGKVSSIELIVLGQGYSQYKTQQSKREQSKCDIVPIVSMDYTLTSNLNINKKFLNIKNLSFDRASLTASLNHGVRLASVSEDLAKYEAGEISVEQQIKIDKYLKNRSYEDVDIENNSVGPYISLSNQVVDAALKTLDSLWDIILKLYPEASSNPYDELTIYNQDLDPGVNEFQDSQDSSLAGPSKDATSITAVPTSLSNTDYSVFVWNDLVIIPDGSPALSIVHRDNATPWLTILPLSSRADGAIGYGALPNMAPRAEMFNRLAIAINHLSKVRLIIPKTIEVQKSTTNTYWIEPSVEAEASIKFSRAGATTSSSHQEHSLQPLTATIEATAFQSVYREELTAGTYVLPDGESRGNYVISAEQTCTLKVDYKIHPFFTNAIAELDLGSIEMGKLLLLMEIKIGSCVSEPATIIDNKPTMRCVSLDKINGNYNIDQVIPIRSINSTSFSRNFVMTGGTLNKKLEAKGGAYGFSRKQPGSTFQGRAFFCEKSCESSVTNILYPQLVNFYPHIINV